MHTLQSLISVGPPVLACDTTYDGNCVPDASAGLVSSLDVDTVTMGVTEASGWSFTLVGSPRQSSVRHWGSWPRRRPCS